jgi:hypothetical protein
MLSSRGIAVLGMHRNGTSLLTRGLQSLGVSLGDNFLETQPDNPTGYWEDRTIVSINERVLGVFGLRWESVAAIPEDQWAKPGLQPLASEAAAYLKLHFLGKPLWGFKDPRTIRLLPFWRPILHSLTVSDDYVVAIRNPLSVVRSLRQRQGMEAPIAYLLWLLYMVPGLNQIADRPFVVVDYDLVMADPRRQLERIAGRLNIALDDGNHAEIGHFAEHFVDPTLRHNLFQPSDFDTIPHLSPLSRRAYSWLQQLATDRIDSSDSGFWAAWHRLGGAVEQAVAKAAATVPGAAS